MKWQDAVFAIGSVIFILALVPMLRTPAKPPYRTSLNTAVVLLCFAATYLSLSLWFSALTTSITGGMWLALALQRRLNENH